MFVFVSAEASNPEPRASKFQQANSKWTQQSHLIAASIRNKQLRPKAKKTLIILLFPFQLFEAHIFPREEPRTPRFGFEILAMF